MILITGSTTLTGRIITDKLIADGNKIRTLDFDNEKPMPDGIERMTCSKLDSATWKKALQGVETVIHLLDLKKSSKISRKQVKKINIEGVKNLTSSAKEAGVQKIVFMSSYEVYGNQKKVPIKEETVPKPKTAFGKDKLKAERILAAYIKNNTLDITILRPAFITGPGTDNPEILITLFMALAMEEDNRLYIAGSGNNRFQMLDPSDAADAVILTIKNTASIGKIYNIGSDNVPTQVEQVVKMKETARLNCEIKRISPLSAKFLSIIFKPMKINYLTKDHVYYLTNTMLLDCQHIKNELGWAPVKENTGILADTIDWYKSAKL